MKKNLKTAALLSALSWIGAVQAGPVLLTKLDDKQVLDRSTNLIWVSDWNLAKTSGYDSDGLMSWQESINWVNKLNADNYAGYNTWRLPEANYTASSNCLSNRIRGVSTFQYHGYGCTGSELGHLFYEVLGGKQDESLLKQTGDSAVEKANLALFTNVQGNGYWTGTQYAPNPFAAWSFLTNSGYQLPNNSKRDLFSAVAVRSGDVSAAVPEPQSLALTLTALGGALLARRRRKV